MGQCLWTATTRRPRAAGGLERTARPLDAPNPSLSPSPFQCETPRDLHYCVHRRSSAHNLTIKEGRPASTALHLVGGTTRWPQDALYKDESGGPETEQRKDHTILRSIAYA